MTQVKTEISIQFSFNFLLARPDQKDQVRPTSLCCWPSLQGRRHSGLHDQWPDGHSLPDSSQALYNLHSGGEGYVQVSPLYHHHQLHSFQSSSSTIKHTSVPASILQLSGRRASIANWTEQFSVRQSESHWEVVSFQQTRPGRGK